MSTTKNSVKKIHVLLIGESHANLKKQSRVRKAHLAEIKKFKARQLCLEESRTDLGVKTCNAINKGERDEDNIKQMLKEWWGDFYVESLKRFDQKKPFFRSKPFFQKNFSEQELEEISAHIQKTINTFQELMTTRFATIGIPSLEILPLLIKEYKIRIEFIDMPDYFLTCLHTIFNYYEAKEEWVEKKFEELRSKKSARVMNNDMLSVAQKEFISSLNKATLVSESKTKFAEKRDCKIYKNLMNVMRDRTAVITGNKHAKYIYDKLKKDKRYEVRYVYIDKKGRKKVIAPGK